MVAAAFWLAACLFPAAAEGPVPYAVTPEESVFAVLVYKGGVASALGHNHFIAAAEYDAALTADPADPAATRLAFTAPAAKLAADDPERSKAWNDALEAAGLIEAPYPVQPADRRAEIAEHMLGPGQLDAAAFPEIKAEVLSVAERPMTIAGRSYPYTVQLKVTVRDKSVERDVAAAIAFAENGALTVEAVGDFAFTEFGIKPFSAAFGAVRNKDAFRIYVNVTAAPSDVR